MYGTWIARESLVGGVGYVVAVGVQPVIRRYSIEYFFERPLEDLLTPYTRIIRNTRGVASPATAHLEALWALDIRARPEGTLAPSGSPTNHADSQSGATTDAALRAAANSLRMIANESGGTPSQTPWLVRPMTITIIECARAEINDLADGVRIAVP